MTAEPRGALLRLRRLRRPSPRSTQRLRPLGRRRRGRARRLKQYFGRGIALEVAHRLERPAPPRLRTLRRRARACPSHNPISGANRACCCKLGIDRRDVEILVM